MWFEVVYEVVSYSDEKDKKKKKKRHRERNRRESTVNKYMYIICYCIPLHTFSSWKFSCVISFWPAIAIYIPASKCPVKKMFVNNISISTHSMAFLKVTCSCCVILYMNKKDGRFSILVSTAQLVQTMYMGKMLCSNILIVLEN